VIGDMTENKTLESGKELKADTPAEIQHQPSLNWNPERN